MKWEYCYAEIPVGPDIADQLNEMGQEGWELIQAQQGLQQTLAGQRPVWVMLLKRKILSLAE